MSHFRILVFNFRVKRRSHLEGASQEKGMKQKEMRYNIFVCSHVVCTQGKRNRVHSTKSKKQSSKIRSMTSRGEAKADEHGVKLERNDSCEE